MPRDLHTHHICTDYGCCYAENHSDNSYEKFAPKTVANNIMAYGDHLAWIETQTEKNGCLVDYSYITDQFDEKNCKICHWPQDSDVKGVYHSQGADHGGHRDLQMAVTTSVFNSGTLLPKYILLILYR